MSFGARLWARSDAPQAGPSDPAPPLRCGPSGAGKRKGGRIYVEVRESGEVTFHEGFVTAKEAKRLSGGGGDGEGDAVIAKPVRPEVSGPLNAYIDLHHTEFCREFADAQDHVC